MFYSFGPKNQQTYSISLRAPPAVSSDISETIEDLILKYCIDVVL